MSLRQDIPHHDPVDGVDLIEFVAVFQANRPNRDLALGQDTESVRGFARHPALTF
jgi:hypothetical protein